MYASIKAMTLLIVLALTTGCMAMYQPDPSVINDQYYEQIREWQNRIRQEGWSENLVGDVIHKCVLLSKYEYDRGDHWATPGEFMQRGFRGDCEDIAVFGMGTLKRLEYPHDVRILAVKTLTGDHAVLKVQVPGKNGIAWKIYETVPMPLIEVDQLFYRPIVEFDDKVIVYFQNQRS